MNSYVRPLIMALAAVVLAASVYALYVHYRLVQDPTFTSACEVSATVSCQQVFTSPYGSAFGIPVAAGGAIWSSLVLLLGLTALRTRSREMAARMIGYIFVLATVGLAAVFYYAYASYFVLGVACPVCMTMYAGIIGIFIASASASGPLGLLGSKLGQDVAALRRNSVAQGVAGAWIVAVIALVVLFPREQPWGTVSASGLPEAVPLEEILPEQRAEFEQWLDAQPRHDEARPEGEVRVRVIKFNDYQCPSCRQAYVFYQHIFDQYTARYPGVFVFERRDFPLESECGAGNAGHLAACEAAAAVRMAEEKDRGREMSAWLFEHQAGLTPDSVKEGLEQVAQINDFDDRYQELLPEIRADVALGERLDVQGTPTLFLNGVRMPSIRPVFWDVAIQYELRKAGVAAAEAGE